MNALAITKVITNWERKKEDGNMVGANYKSTELWKCG